MILVIPVSDADIGQAEKLVERIAQLGNEPQIVIASSWGAWWDVDKIMRHVPKAEAVKFDFVDEIGWPESSNHMFLQTAHFMLNHYQEPWYFMEADTCPIKKGWFWALKEEYEKVGKPYMGIISDTVRGSVASGEYWITGKHMTGTAIYPADFLQRCKSIHYLMREPWDIEIGPEILPEVHHTKLIAHRWSTYGYYLQGGQICITRSRATSKFSQAHVQPIPPEAVVVHGCKDGSIYALDQPAVMT